MQSFYKVFRILIIIWNDLKNWHFFNSNDMYGIIYLYKTHRELNFVAIA